MKIIFMGTPEFAVPALKALIESKEHEVVAVFTSAPKARDRGMKLQKTPIHCLAEQHKIDVHTPKTLKNNESLDLVHAIKADIIIVAAYGFIIPQAVLDTKKYGCLNIHPSLLPKYRGAAPLQRTIINGDSETAICIMQMDANLDTGDILMQKNMKLDPRITLKKLHDDCANIGADLLLKTLENIDNIKPIKQSEDGVIYAHKLAKEEGEINWANSSYSIDCIIRGMNPWPGAYFYYNKKLIKVIEAEYTDTEHNYQIGQLINNNFEVACGKGTLIIKTVKPEGKKEINAKDYLNGLRIDFKEETIF